MVNDDQTERAKKYTDKLIDLVIAAKAANENTRHAVYSSRLAGIIPRSYAAHAFTELQNTLLYYSVVRACALFDKAADDRVSLHTVIRDISGQKNERKVARQAYQYHASQHEPRRLTPENDPEINALLTAHWRQHSEKRGHKEQTLVYRRVDLATKIVDRAERLLIKDHLRPFRDNFIAHNLADCTRVDRRINFVLGMENRAIHHAKCAVDQLHKALNGTSFSWAGLEKIQKRNAGEFWDNLYFELPDDRKA